MTVQGNITPSETGRISYLQTQRPYAGWTFARSIHVLPSAASKFLYKLTTYGDIPT